MTHQLSFAFREEKYCLVEITRGTSTAVSLVKNGSKPLLYSTLKEAIDATREFAWKGIPHEYQVHRYIGSCLDSKETYFFDPEVLSSKFYQQEL